MVELKKPGWINPNKMRIETGHKAFDLYCTSVTPGQVIGSGQDSFTVRPHYETLCGGNQYAAGHLQDFDLRSVRASEMPPHINKSIRKIANDRNETVIVYQFFHYSRCRDVMAWGGARRKPTYSSKKIVHGWLITSCTRQPNVQLAMYVTGPTQKSWDVMVWCADVVSLPPSPMPRGAKRMWPRAARGIVPRNLKALARRLVAEIKAEDAAQGPPRRTECA